MTYEEMHKLLRQPPFRPFRVFVDDGRTFDITHPRMNQLARTFVKIGIGAPDLKPPICDHLEWVPLKKIVRVEMVDAIPSSGK